jgi:hypothetical protein
MGWWLEAVGWIGSTVVVMSLLQTRLLRLRSINLVGSLIMVGYNTAIQAWPMVGLNIVLASINIVYLWRLLRSRHDPKAYTVLEVGPDDTYLRHVLRVHEQDIREHNPGFVHDPTTMQLAFLVLRGDETVGVVLGEDAGDGVAQLRLDWVTPRYRDASPGEFVYGQSGIFCERGIRRVITPPGMVRPYYDRLGFERIDDERYALDLEPADRAAG